ncbi:uncharacterized protein [Argopecten irradians]|uniref:uncharacterized protein isoform X1 n=1 Tax=Argopecten irradians TaxID=31199 RepID=UPI003723A7BA
MGLEPTFDQSNIIHTEEREVFDLAVDPKTRTLFWGSHMVFGSLVMMEQTRDTGDALYKLENKYSSPLPTTTTTSVDTIAYDPISKRIYFGSVYSITLYSMRLDGTDVREEATTDLYVQAIAIDSDAGNLFVYSPGYTGNIYLVRMGQEPTLDQSNIIHTDVKEVFYLAVDPKTRRLFWGSTSGVWQSNYEGTNKKILMGPGSYDGIAVDDGKVYVIKDNRILKIDTSTDNSFTEILEVDGSSRAESLIIDGNSLYFGVSTCVDRPTTTFDKFVATVQIDGTGLKYLLPKVSSYNYGDTMSLVYVNRPTRFPDWGIALIIGVLVLLVITISICVCLWKKYRSSGKCPIQGKSYEVYTKFDTESHFYGDLTCNVYEVQKYPSKVDFKFDTNNQKQKLELMYRGMDPKTPNHMPDGKQWYTNQDKY